MKKAWKYLCKVSSLGLQRFVVNRKNLAVVILFEVLDAVASIILIEVLYNYIQAIAGFTKYEMYFLAGITLCQLKIMMCFCIGGIGSISEKVNNRDVDFVLLKPFSSRLMLMVPNTNIHQLLSMSVAVYMVVYGIFNCDASSFAGVSSLNIAAGIVGFGLGVIFLINIFSIVSALSFWVVNISSISDFVFNLQGNANYPKDMYPKPIKLLLIFVFPIILFANPCSMAIFNKSSWKLFLILQIAYVLLSEIVKRIIWHFGVQHYKTWS